MAHQAHLQAGNRSGVGDALAFLGSVALSEGDMRAAERYLTASIELFDALGLSIAEEVRLQLANTLLLSDQARKAEPVLKRLVEYHDEFVNEPSRRFLVHLTMAAQGALQADVTRWDEHVARALPCKPDEILEVDTSTVLEKAGDTWLGRGDRERAGVAYEFALWMSAAGDTDRLVQLESKMRQLS